MEACELYETDDVLVEEWYENGEFINSITRVWKTTWSKYYQHLAPLNSSACVTQSLNHLMMIYDVETVTTRTSTPYTD